MKIRCPRCHSDEIGFAGHSGWDFYCKECGTYFNRG